MKKMRKMNITRRDFIKAAATVPFLGAFSLDSILKSSLGKKEKTRVVLIRDINALNERDEPNQAVVQKMLDEAVMALLDEGDPLSAWKRLIKPDDIVGIKSNVWHYIPTTREVEQAVKRRVKEVGVAEENISIDDRGVRRNPVFQKATALINARPGRTHHWSGMGTCIKNYIMFVPSPPAYHGDSCADLASIWYDYNLKEKTRLNILVMFTPLFHGIGPHHYSKKYTWPYRGMVVGIDPVAVDATGVRILEAKRKEYFGEERPLKPMAKHIYLADTKYNLGTSDPDKIELIKLGWAEGSLI